MLETETAWLAGYIDGDGSISISRKTGRRFGSLIIAIDSTDLEILEYVQDLVGGNIVRKKKYADHHRQAYTWRLLGANNIIDLCTQVAPYLKCNAKKARAELIRDHWREATPANGQYDEQRLAKKVRFEEEFMRLGEGRGSRIKDTEADSDLAV